MARGKERIAGRATAAGPGIRGFLAVTFAALLAPILAGCGGNQGAGSGESPVRVVATYSILGDLVENVGDERVDLTTLVGPDGDAHTFEPAPSDNADLAQAEVIFENGLGFEPWLDDLYGSSGSEARRVAVTRNVDTRPVAEEEHAGEGHEAGETDPHVWHDVNNAVVMVEEIRDALSKADPKNAEAYEKNAGEETTEPRGPRRRGAAAGRVHPRGEPRTLHLPRHLRLLRGALRLRGGHRARRRRAPRRAVASLVRVLRQGSVV